MSARRALERFYQRQMADLERVQRPRRRTTKPEEDVKRAVMAWLTANGFSMNVVEAKAVYSPAAGRYVRGQTAAGVVDLLGCTPDGLGAFIELKAPGRLATLREGQRAFLIDKIERGAFACVVDSVERVEQLWREFSHRRKMEPKLASAFLYRHLPTKN